LLAHLTRPYQPSPEGLPGRPAHRPFRGLLSVYSRCGLHTRAVTNSCPATRRLQTFRLLHACSGCFRLERLPGGACTNWKAPPCHGAHPQRSLTPDRATHQCGRRLRRIDPAGRCRAFIDQLSTNTTARSTRFHGIFPPELTETEAARNSHSMRRCPDCLRRTRNHRRRSTLSETSTLRATG